MGTKEEFRFLILDSLKYSSKVESPVNRSAKAVINRNITTSRHNNLFNFLFIYLLFLFFILFFYIYLLKTGITVLSV